MKFPTFSRYAQAYDVQVDEETHMKFMRYANLLSDWSRRVRLISLGDQSQIWSRHFLDSLAGCAELPAASRVLDLGSGGGFPGIPLKLVRPDIHLTLLDATRMKCLFLKHVVSELGLDDVEVIHGRAEEQSRTGEFDVVTVRAVGSMEEIHQLSRPFLRDQGKLVAYKGPEEEIALGNATFMRKLVTHPESGRTRAIVIVSRST